MNSKKNKNMSIFNTNLLALLFLIIGQANAQQNVKVYAENTPEGISIYVDNFEYCPITIAVDFNLKNMILAANNQGSYLIKGSSKKELLTSVTVIDKHKPSKFDYTYSVGFGDSNQKEYDKDFTYYLPFEKGSSFGLHQGYNGSFSHQDENALDFTMPVGTPITAVRDGVVVKVVESNVLVCPKKECAKYNNYLLIYHSDGTFAEYTHIKKNGVLVNVGDKITQGQIIANSGNTGWSSGPHLHLVIFLERTKSRETIPTKFKIGDGTISDFLKEKETYSRDY